MPCLPWLARVAYALVMSSTLAVAGPSAMDGEACRSGVSVGDAEVDRGVLDLGGADVLGHLRVDGVDGLVGGGADGDVAVADVVLVGGGVAGGAVRPIDHALVGAVVDGVGGDRAGRPGSASRSATAEAKTNGLKVEPTW